MRWADLRLRILSAAVLAPLALVCLWLGGWPWTLLIWLAAAGLAIEWVHLCAQLVAAPAGAAMLAAVLLAAGVAVDHTALALALLAGAVAAIWLLGRRLGLGARLALGVLYIGLTPPALLWLRDDATAGRANLLFLLLVVWASDIGAYLVGRLIGGPRLAPAISPGKTWSGAAGGLVAAGTVGWLTAWLLAPGSAARMVAVAAALGVVAQAGDLMESAIKRRFGVKDSSHLIPGHGGLLDRLDGVLTAAPAAALLAMALGRGVVLWR